MGNLENRANRLGAAMGALGAALGMAFALREVFQMADAWASVNARVSLVTHGAEEQKFVTDSLYNIAVKTRQEYVTTADLYGKIARNAKELSLTQGDILGLTEDINKALIIGGGSTQENQSAVLQLGQALASGRLQGDEFRSLMENAPRLTNAIAEGMGVGIGQLRSMSKAGELTAKVVIGAIRSQSAKLEKEFMQMPTTIGQAITGVGLRVGKFLQDLEKETGVFKSIAQGIAKVFGAIDDGIRAASTRVGGFKNLIRLTGYAVASLSLAMFAFNNKLVTTTRWIAFFRLLRMSIIATSRAAWAMMLNPLFWKAALIAAAIALVVLAFEDLYYWITGGESVIGKYAGTWEEFKTNAINKITEVKNAFFEWLTSMLTSFAKWSSSLLTAFAQWSSNMIVGFISLMVSIYNTTAEFLNPIYTLFAAMFTGIVTQLKLFVQLFKQIINGDFAGVFDTLGMMWENMKRTAIGVFDSIIQYAKNLLSFLNPVASIIGKMMGLDIGNIKMTTSANLSMAGASARTGNVTINQTNQLLSGTPAQQANFVQDATQQAADSMFRATLHTEYAT